MNAAALIHQTVNQFAGLVGHPAPVKHPPSIATSVHVDGITFNLDATYLRGSRGAREGGLQIEPDEAAGYEIHGIYLDGSDVELTDFLSTAAFDAIQDAADRSAQEG